MREEMQRLGFKSYLGDGVYAGWDGYQIVLWLESTGAYGPNTIALGPQVLDALDGLRKRIGERDD